jgi:hypothetical protein
MLFMMVILAPSNPLQSAVLPILIYLLSFIVAAAAQRPLRRVTQRGSCLATSGATRAGPIAIDNVPLGMTLVSGLTATVTTRDGKDAENGTLCKKPAPNSRRTSSD